MIESILFLINSERVRPLILDSHLSQKAQQRAEYLCTHEFSHNGWEESFKGIQGFIGENLADGFVDATSTHKALMDSPTHKANIVKSQYTKVGIGRACKTNTIVELFN